MKPIFIKSYYRGFDLIDIFNQIRAEGFEPLKITNKKGEDYSAHTHPEKKLIAVLEGSMLVTAGNATFICEKGDQIIIPGNLKHSAVIGENGCTFFWAEKSE